MTRLSDVDWFKVYIQVYMWLGFPPLTSTHLERPLAYHDQRSRLGKRLQNTERSLQCLDPSTKIKDQGKSERVNLVARSHLSSHLMEIPPR